MSRLTREDEHRLNEYNRRVKEEGGLDSLSEDDQLWFSLLTNRYEKFLDVGMRIMNAAAQKERPQKASEKEKESSSGGGGGLLGFLANVGGGSYSGSKKAPTATPMASSSNAANGIRSPPAQHNNSSSLGPQSGPHHGGAGDADDEADLLGSPYASQRASSPFNTSNGTNCGAFGHPPPPAPADEFPSTHWTWIQENLVVGALPFAGSGAGNAAVGQGGGGGGTCGDTTGHVLDLSEQCLRRYSRVALVVSCMEIDESAPAGFCADGKDWEGAGLGNGNGSAAVSFISVPLPKDPNQPIPKAMIQDVISACAQISAISHANMRGGGGGTNPLMSGSVHGSPIGARSGGGVGGASGGSGASLDGAVDGTADATTVPSGGSFGNRESIAFASGADCPSPSASTSQYSASTPTPTPAPSSSPSRVSIVGGALRRLTQAHSRQPERKKVAYVHCKAGAQRCYVVAACYLMSQHARSPDEVERFLRGLRPAFRPSAAQLEFVKAFGEYIARPLVLQPRSDDEERYQTVLAEVLSLSVRSRERLLRDLEKLT